LADLRSKDETLVNLRIKDLKFGYNSKAVLRGICLEFQTEVTALIGPNAAGKSTLLKCLSGLLRGDGEIWVDGEELKTISRKELIRKIGYLPQDLPSTASLTVFEAVLLGRVQTLGWRIRNKDLAAALETLTALGLEHLAYRRLNELSGGQRQMVSIGQALVRRPEILVMDEPTNSLDIQHQLELFELIRSVTKSRRMTTILALHDLNLAARFADGVVLIHQGKIRAAGKAAEVITKKMLEKVYGIHARVMIDQYGVPQIFPISSVTRNKAV
jgi:iron complex transport system ATP-binding protein